MFCVLAQKILLFLLFLSDAVASSSGGWHANFVLQICFSDVNVANVVGNVTVSLSKLYIVSKDLYKIKSILLYNPVRIKEEASIYCKLKFLKE